MAAGACGSTEGARRQHYPRENRLRKRFEFRLVRDSARRVHTSSLLLMVRKNELGTQRLGITVTKQIADAVGRNRIKRLVREVFRRNRELFPEGSDVVVVAKRGAKIDSYEAARAEIAQVHKALSNAAVRPARRPGGAA